MSTWVLGQDATLKKFDIYTLNIDLPKQVIEICDAKSFIAFDVARQYFLAKRDKARLLESLNNDSNLVKLADEFISGFESGEYKHYCEFGADAFLKCTEENGITSSKSRGEISNAFARMDISFFLISSKHMGISREAAVKRVRKMFPENNLYSTPLIEAASDVIYNVIKTEDEENDFLHYAVWSFLYPRSVE